MIPRLQVLCHAENSSTPTAGAASHTLDSSILSSLRVDWDLTAVTAVTHAVLHLDGRHIRGVDLGLGLASPVAVDDTPDEGDEGGGDEHPLNCRDSGGDSKSNVGALPVARNSFAVDGIVEDAEGGCYPGRDAKGREPPELHEDFHDENRKVVVVLWFGTGREQVIGADEDGSDAGEEAPSDSAITAEKCKTDCVQDDNENSQSDLNETDGPEPGWHFNKTLTHLDGCDVRFE